MNYFCFTNNKLIAKALDPIKDIDTIFIDLEILGKQTRQGHTNSLISKHDLEDISELREVISQSKLGVRINPLNQNSQYEIEKCIKKGADVLMLPMFQSPSEVKTIIEMIDERCNLDLLIETPRSIELYKKFDYTKIRFAHFGLNDLSLAFEYKHLFFCFFSKILDKYTHYLNFNKIPFGLGGIGAIGSKPFDPKLIFAANKFFKSSRLILSRSFLNQIDTSSQEKANISAQSNFVLLQKLHDEVNVLDHKQIKEIMDHFYLLLKASFDN